MEVFVYYPKSREKMLELQKNAAILHAQAVINKIENLSYSAPQKKKLIEEIKKSFL